MKKSYTKTGNSCRVTFEVRPDEAVEQLYLVGDFNNWEPGRTPLQRRRDGRFSATVSVPTGRTYRFRYRTEDGRWLNDPEADGYAPNDYGSEDSLLNV